MFYEARQTCDGNFTTDSAWILENDSGFIEDEEYITVTYKVVNGPNDTYDGIEYLEGFDEVIFYKNGILYGFAYYDHNVYENGLEIWNNDNCPFFIGACPWDGDNRIYYLNGLIYCTRLYEKTFTPTEVKDNYEQTLKYRDKLKDIG